jgi:hypothetical protein
MLLLCGESFQNPHYLRKEVLFMPELTGIPLLLASVGQVFTAAVSWLGDVGDAIVGTPVLLLFAVGVPLCGLGVGMFKRLLSTHG